MTKMTNEEFLQNYRKALMAAVQAGRAQYPTLTNGAIVTAKNGKQYRVFGEAYVGRNGKIMVAVKGQKDGKDFGPFRYMQASSF